MVAQGPPTSAQPTPSRPPSSLSAAIRACRRHLIFAGLFSALVNILYLAPTLYMLQVYDRVVPTRGQLTLLFLTLALILALGTLSLLDWARSRILVRAGARLERKLAGAVLDAGLSRRRSDRDVLASSAMREFDLLRTVLTGPAILALFDAPWAPIYILVSFMIHPLLGALSLVGAVILFGLAVINEKATKGPLHRANEAASASYLSQQHSVTNAETVRALGMRRAMVERHLRERQVTGAQQLEANFAASGLTSLSRFVRIALQSIALGLGAYLAINQKVSAGGIFAASLLIGRALSPIDLLLGSWRSLGQAREAYRDLSELLPETDHSHAQTELPPPSGALQVEHLVVLRPGGEGVILNDISFKVAAGEVVGVIGSSGAGKSTLVRVLANAGQADRGLVRFDGAETSQWDPERLARYIGYMPQETTLFAGTIKQNIARFSAFIGEAAEEIDRKAIAAGRLAGAHELILRLPNGYDTALGWGGRGLAAGHAQRIALARALYGDPKILLLDEPNAHLDAEGEALLTAAIAACKARGASVMIVAHRTGVLGAVDTLMMLHDGRIELLGPRDEVVKRLAAAQQGRTAVVRQPMASE
jgi:PrtD family type I secretion system ABC transporter